MAARALRQLRLLAVWALVSPQNPLKPRTGMAPLADRLAGARATFRHPRIIATAIEAELGTRFTADTLALLRRRFGRARFVFVMGADSFASLHRWDRWRAIVRVVPIAVMPRPGFTRAALAGPAARAFGHARRRPAALAGSPPPAWTMLEGRQDHASATRIRAGRG